MSDEQQNDLVNTLVEVAPGVQVESRLRVSSMMWLEKKFDLPFVKIFNRLTPDNQEDIRISDITLLIQALYMQAHPTMSEQDAEAKIASLEISDLVNALGKITAFELVPKNESTPEPPAATTAT